MRLVRSNTAWNEHVVIYSDSTSVIYHIRVLGRRASKLRYASCIDSLRADFQLLRASFEAEGGSLELQHVRAHSGNVGNDLAHSLAVWARKYGEIMSKCPQPEPETLEKPSLMNEPSGALPEISSGSEVPRVTRPTMHIGDVLTAGSAITALVLVAHVIFCRKRR